MTWNASLIHGPIAIPVLGDPNPETGERELLGHVEGYRLNVAQSVYASTVQEDGTSPLDAHLETPDTPHQVWAGDEPEWSTVFLRFDDEAEAHSKLSEYWCES